MRIPGNTIWQSALAASLCGMLFSPVALHATTPAQLWPTFSKPSTIMNVNLVGAGQNGYDFMATTTFQGAYNQNQLSTRLYISTISDDPYWLENAVPANNSGVTVSQFAFDTSNPDGALIALLQTYGSSIKGYYICDPYNTPETCNMATTSAGINDAMVVNPDNLTVMQNTTDNPSVPLLADLRTYTWVGSNQSLIANTAINMINNPSGSSGTTGWSTSGGTVATGTDTGTCAGQGQTLEFTSTTTSPAWAYFPPAITATATTRPYIFSVQACVASGSPAFLDVWNGGGDIQSTSIAAGSGWQTLQLAVPIPLSDISGNTTIKLEVRTTGTNGTVIYFHNAAAIGNRVAVDTYQYANLLSQTTSTILAQDFANSHNLRDYVVAGKMFVFDLSSDNADEVALYNNILTTTSSSGTARAHNTPVMGYIDDETNDVPYLSGSGRGLFLNASDDYNNGSVWASLPQPSGLSQPAPVAVAPANNTIYVAMAASDGDNLSIVQHQDYQHWTLGQYLGAVPMAWTVSPGMIYNSPGILTTFYNDLPQSQELMAGPSGVGYGVGTTGSDVSPFADLTNGFMTMEGMNTVTNWFASSTDLDSFAQDVNVLHVVKRGALAYSGPQNNSAHTVLDGQAVDYNAFPEKQIAAIQGVAFTSGVPNYIEVLHDNLTMPPDDVLYIAQQLQLRGSHPYVFMTPSEMAATELASGSASTNTQAVAGSTLTTAFPVNYIWNWQGQEPGAGVENGHGTGLSGWGIGNPVQGQVLYTNQDFLGGGNMMMTVPKSATSNSYAWQYLGTNPNPMVVGRYYRFSVNVAGTLNSTAFMTIYDGSANHTVTGTISPTGWTNLSQIVQMQNATTGQIQVGVQPLTTANQTLYFSGTPGDMPGWFYGAGQGSGTTATASFGATTYNSAQGPAQAFYLNNPANDGTQWMDFYPTGLTSGTTYVASADVAGTGTAYVAFYNGSGGANSATVTLSNNWQTISVSSAASGSNPPRFQVVAPGATSNQTVYFRNASLSPAPANAPWFTTGIESGQPQPLTSTVDTTSPGGNEAGVSGAILLAASTASHGGTYSIQYGGTASGGSSTHAYMEAFTNGSTLTSTSRLSYWVYPVIPAGTVTTASSTCVALDIVFTDGTALRDDTGITDQYGNQLHPAHECGHLQPNQWNYVTANLGSLSGQTVSRIDIGYDQPGASGNYGGYVDDITLSY